MLYLIKSLSYLSLLVSYLMLAGCTTYGRGTSQVEVVEASDNQTLSLLQQVRALEQENAQLKNLVEVGQYDMDQINRRVQAQQSELDRLYQEAGLGNYNYQEDQSVEGQYPTSSNQGGYRANESEVLIGNNPEMVGEVPVNNPSNEVITPIASSRSNQSAQSIYNQGYEQLKQGNYLESIQSFSLLLQQDPTSSFADDAQYWMGEAYYVNRDFVKATQAFNRVNENYPNSDRAADAKLKVGYIYYEQGDVINARRVFEDIIVRYPNQRVADFARERLKHINN